MCGLFSLSLPRLRDQIQHDQICGDAQESVVLAPGGAECAADAGNRAAEAERAVPQAAEDLPDPVAKGRGGRPLRVVSSGRHRGTACG